MNQLLLLVGVTGALFFLIKFYYTLSVLEYLYRNDMDAIKNALGSWHIERAFKIFIFSIFIYSTGMILAGTGIVIDRPYFTVFEIIAGGVMSLGFIYFLRTIYLTLRV
ncbi:MAG: hypothetical protein SVU32_03550 [Candidatus Nanohaloarchaea archaeon]|nr:hypothetical protein [Candidatus Nanohaloarchaea archaeon]